MKLEADGLNLTQVLELRHQLRKLGVSFEVKCSHCGWPLAPYLKQDARDGYRHRPDNPHICVRAEGT